MGGAIGNIHWELGKTCWELDGTDWEQQPKNSTSPSPYPQNEKSLEPLGAH